MPRRARLRLADYPIHLIQRGHNRAACFCSAADFLEYLRHLHEQSNRFGCALHAYVLMTNHVHLLLTPETADGPSLLIKHLGQRYVQYFNRTHARSGTLWEGRFRSSIVQEQRYLLTCHRYIELNPVRAGMVRHPRDYPWSSYRANAEAKPSRLLSTHAEYRALGGDDVSRTAAYRALFDCLPEPAEIEEIRIALNGGYVLGDERFKARAAATLKRRVARGAPGRPSSDPGQSVSPR